MLRYAFSVVALTLLFTLGAASISTSTTTEEPAKEGPIHVSYQCRFPYHGRDDTELTIAAPNHPIKAVNYASSNGQWCHVTLEGKDKEGAGGLIPC